MQIGIIGLIIYITFKIITSENIDSYEELTKKFVGDKKILNYVVNNVINIFLAISFLIMVAGFGAYFNQEFNLPIIVGAATMAILLYVTFLNKIEGLIKINEYLIPVLIIIIVILGIKCNINFSSIMAGNIQNNNSGIIKSILYASYNSIILIPILINLKKLISNKVIKNVPIIVTTIMLVLSIIIYILLKMHIDEIANVEIPMVYIAGKLGIIYKYIYGVVIIIAMFTTALSAGYSFLSNICQNKKQYKITSMALCIIAVTISNVGFSKLLGFLYPILGWIGLVQVLSLFIYFSWKHLEKNTLN